MKSKFFKVTKNTVKPKRPEHGWLMAEQLEDLADAGFDNEALGTDLVYLIGEDGAVFEPVTRGVPIASEGYLEGWKFKGKFVYWDQGQGWMDWEDLPRETQKRLIPHRGKRWIPEGQHIPEPKRRR